jgi:hemoglobin
MDAVPADRRLAGSERTLDEGTIRVVVEEFYAVARQDDVIGPVFKRVVPSDRWREHIDTIVDFWSSMLLGTGRYTGRPLRKHLVIPELEDRHFRRWLALFRHTAERVCNADAAAVLVERSERVGNSFRMNVAMHRGEDMIHMKPLEREHFPARTDV